MTSATRMVTAPAVQATCRHDLPQTCGFPPSSPLLGHSCSMAYDVCRSPSCCSLEELVTETAALAVECINWDEHVVVRTFFLAGAIIESHSGGPITCYQRDMPNANQGDSLTKQTRMKKQKKLVIRGRKRRRKKNKTQPPNHPVPSHRIRIPNPPIPGNPQRKKIKGGKKKSHYHKIHIRPSGVCFWFVFCFFLDVHPPIPELQSRSRGKKKQNTNPN